MGSEYSKAASGIEPASIQVQPQPQPQSQPQTLPDPALPPPPSHPPAASSQRLQSTQSAEQQRPRSRVSNPIAPPAPATTTTMDPPPRCARIKVHGIDELNGTSGTPSGILDPHSLASRRLGIMLPLPPTFQKLIQLAREQFWSEELEEYQANQLQSYPDGEESMHPPLSTIRVFVREGMTGLNSSNPSAALSSSWGGEILEWNYDLIRDNDVIEVVRLPTLPPARSRRKSKQSPTQLHQAHAVPTANRPSKPADKTMMANGKRKRSDDEMEEKSMNYASSSTAAAASSSATTAAAKSKPVAPINPTPSAVAAPTTTTTAPSPHTPVRARPPPELVTDSPPPLETAAGVQVISPTHTALEEQRHSEIVQAVYHQQQQHQPSIKTTAPPPPSSTGGSALQAGSSSSSPPNVPATGPSPSSLPTFDRMRLIPIFRNMNNATLDRLIALNYISPTGNMLVDKDTIIEALQQFVQQQQQQQQLPQSLPQPPQPITLPQPINPFVPQPMFLPIPPGTIFVPDIMMQQELMRQQHLQQLQNQQIEMFQALPPDVQLAIIQQHTQAAAAMGQGITALQPTGLILPNATPNAQPPQQQPQPQSRPQTPSDQRIRRRSIDAATPPLPALVPVTPLTPTNQATATPIAAEVVSGAPSASTNATASSAAPVAIQPIPPPPVSSSTSATTPAATTSSSSTPFLQTACFNAIRTQLTREQHLRLFQSSNEDAWKYFDHVSNEFRRHYPSWLDERFKKFKMRVFKQVDQLATGQPGGGEIVQQDGSGANSHLPTTPTAALNPTQPTNERTTVPTPTLPVATPPNVIPTTTNTSVVPPSVATVEHGTLSAATTPTTMTPTATGPTAATLTADGQISATAPSVGPPPAPTPDQLQFNFHSFAPSSTDPTQFVAGPPVTIRAKRHKPLSKIFNAYGRFREKPVSSFKFYRPSDWTLTKDRLTTEPSLYDTIVTTDMKPEDLSNNWDQVKEVYIMVKEE